MNEEESPESHSFPDLEKSIVTDDNDHSDSSEIGRHETSTDHSSVDLLHQDRAASLHEPSLDEVIPNNENHVSFTHPSSIEHMDTPTKDDIVYDHQAGGESHAVSQEETSLVDHKDDPSQLMDPHDLPHSLEDPPIDDSPIRIPEPPQQCVICGNDTGKPLLRFPPVDHDLLVSAAAPGVNTFTMDISLHVFCGRTASILPHVNRPDLEILPKAGIKNKHGIGQEVNAALARTRCAVLTEAGSKEKSFYLVREFEANLAAVRNSSIQFHHMDVAPLLLGNYLPGDSATEAQPPPVIQQVEAFMDMQHEGLFAAESPPRKRFKSYTKEFCACGGSYSNPSSWRNHIRTRRHQRWVEQMREEAS